MYKKFEKTNKSEPIQLLPRSIAGNYNGYTDGRSKPTLYFENGHFTQVHGNKNNVGWHPELKEGVLRRNIKEDIQDKWINLYSKKNKNNVEISDLAILTNEIMNGKYDDQDGLLFEFHYGGSGVRSYHPSGGNFKKLGDKNFDNQYDENYAINVVEKGKLADNEENSDSGKYFNELLKKYWNEMKDDDIDDDERIINMPENLKITSKTKLDEKYKI